MQYNYLHDYSTSQWADYGDNGIYLDEQTSGYTVAHNAMVNAPTNVVQNQNGHEHHHRHPREQPDVRQLHGRDRGILCRHQDHDDSSS